MRTRRGVINIKIININEMFSFFYIILKIKNSKIFDSFFTAYEIDKDEFLVLLEICESRNEKENYLTRISETTLLSKSKTSRIIDKLLEKKFISKIITEKSEDRRKHYIVKTELGQGVLGKILTNFRNKYFEKLQSFKEDHLILVNTTLEEILSNIGE